MYCNTVLTALSEAIHRPREEEDLVSDTYTYTKDACMHSNTTSFVVNASAPPHTIKVPIKGHYGFSTSSNHRESSSTARTLRAHRCLLCCHPKELRLIHKLYDHNYWSKLKCNNNINSEPGNKKKVWAIPVSGAKWEYWWEMFILSRKISDDMQSRSSSEALMYHKRAAFCRCCSRHDSSITQNWKY